MRDSRTRPSDGFLRQSDDDEGVTSERPEGRLSPALLLRARPDLDLAEIEELSVDFLGETTPAFGRDSFLYFEVRNRGRKPLYGGHLGVWTSAIDSPQSFPADWSADDFFLGSSAAPVPGHFIEVGVVPPAGTAVIGPIGWRPTAPTGGGDCEGAVDLMVRLVHLADGAPPTTVAPTATQSNNFALRRVPLVPAECVPEPDRFEGNDSPRTAALLDANWVHLSGRCAPHVSRSGEPPYPDARCPGIFENYDFLSPGTYIPQATEEIWRLRVPDLSLHSTTDRDFFRLDLPDTADPRWGLEDITPTDLQPVAGAAEPTYRPVPMPECGSIQRRDPTRPGRAPRSGLAEPDHLARCECGTHRGRRKQRRRGTCRCVGRTVARLRRGRASELVGRRLAAGAALRLPEDPLFER